MSLNEKLKKVVVARHTLNLCEALEPLTEQDPELHRFLDLEQLEELRTALNAFEVYLLRSIDLTEDEIEITEELYEEETE